MKRRYANMGSFTLLFTDLILLNIVVSVLPHLSDAMYTQFIIVNNLSWLLASYIAESYTRKKKTWAGRLIKASASGYSLLLCINWVLYTAVKPELHDKHLITSLLLFGIYILLSRMLLISIRGMLTKNKRLSKKIVIIGGNETAAHMIGQFEREGSIYSVCGIFSDEDPVASLNRFPKYSVNECISFAKEQQITEIYTTLSLQEDKRLYAIAESAERNFIQFKVVPDISHYLRMKPDADKEIKLPVLCLTPEPEADLPGQLQKRIFDVIFSSLVIIFILSWLAPLLAFLIKLESEGPVFFKQLRTGKNGRPFLCFKFRSLKMNDEADSKQVTANDSRYTRIGKFMRKTNLDEMPQFFNVLLGDMSVVGSRPHMLKHTEDYARLHKRYMTRHYVKPGVTGWAQVNGYRGEIKIDEQLIKRVDHDIWYLENWNFWLDMRIVFQTFTSTFKGDKNAY